jgi:hypothetical protein
MNKKLGKKAIELALNTVIMLIIGLVLFGLGISLFAKIAGSGDDQIDQMRAEIVDSLAGLECNSQEWICVPSTKIDQGDSRTISIYVTNLADTSLDLGIEIDETSSPSISKIDNSYSIEKANCGTVILTPYPTTIPVARGEVAKIPMFIDTDRVSSSCSFTTVVELTNDEKAPVIIQVE